MASLHKDQVDFSKLEKDVYAAIESEARYSRENSAKFRAVDQKVATYEEFRDIVKASHLRPLEKKDKMPEQFVQPWNTTILGKDQSSSPAYDSASVTKINTSMKVPATSLALVNDWRRLKTDKEKLEYLLFINGERLKTIFTTEISGGLLGDILKVLIGHDDGSSMEITQILDALSSAKRFKLDLQFMSSSEKEICTKLFMKLKENERLTQVESQCEEDDSEDKKNDYVETVKHLATKFEIAL